MLDTGTYELELVKTANQSLSTRANGYSIWIRLRTFKAVTYADIKVNDEYVATGFRCADSAYMLPFPVARKIGGNIYFKAKGGGYPNYENFDGVNARLMFDIRENPGFAP